MVNSITHLCTGSPSFSVSLHCPSVGASLILQLVKHPPAMQETQFSSWVRKICWRRDRLPTPVFLGFLCGSAGKEYTCNVGDLGSILGLGRSHGEGKGYPLQYSGLESSMDCIGSQRVRHDWANIPRHRHPSVNILSDKLLTCKLCLRLCIPG